MQVFMLALAIGFPLAVFFAWAFEMTPEGVKRESEVDRSQSITSKTGRKMDRSIIIILALALAYFAYDKFSGKETDSASEAASQSSEAVMESPAPTISRASKTDEKSIAVLPLVNRSVNAEDAFFAEGLHDELLTLLSRVSALKVISRTSVMGYAGTTKRIPEIAAELGVTSLLEGGVQRSGDRVRINVQLIDAVTDEHLWAEVYDRELTADNLFDIQSDITRSIADALQAVLTGEERQNLEQKSTDNVEAYAYYLRGKADSKGYGRLAVNIRKSIAYFQATIDLDPEFAAAHASLAIDWTELYWTSDRRGDELERALTALQKAQELAPDSPDTLIAEGYFHYWGHLDYAKAALAFDRALQREPGNYLALRGKSYVLRRLGDFDASIETMEKVISIDPLYGEIYADLAYTLLRVGQLEQAKVMLDRSVTLAAERPLASFALTEFYLMTEKLEDAWQVIVATVEDQSQLQGYYLDFKLLVGRAQSNAERVDEVLNSYLQIDSQSLGPLFARGLVYLDRGEQGNLDILIEELKEQVDNFMQEDRKGEVTLQRVIQLYGLQKDKARLAEAITAYHAAVKPDALRLVENRSIPIALAVAGDTEALLNFIEKLVEQFGPWEFYYFAIDPSFDSMRDLPRFQALDKQYRQWLEQQS